jgi:hypothetical protein
MVPPDPNVLEGEAPNQILEFRRRDCDPLSVTTSGVAPVRSSASWITSRTSAAVIVVSSSQCTTYRL